MTNSEWIDEKMEKVFKWFAKRVWRFLVGVIIIVVGIIFSAVFFKNGDICLLLLPLSFISIPLFIIGVSEWGSMEHIEKDEKTAGKD